jgi:hypothetical protein
MTVPKTPAITIAAIPPRIYMVVRLEPDGGCVGELEGFVVVEGEEDSVGVGVGVGVSLGVGAGVEEGVVVAPDRIAVIVPGPVIVAVVNRFIAFPSVMLPLLLDHEENETPTLGVTDIESCPESTQRSPPGEVVAAPAGLAIIETKY